jgi:acyl dehydratase
MTATAEVLEQVVLAEPPRLGRLYARAMAESRMARSAGLPATEVVLDDVHVDVEHLAAYDDMCGLRLTDALPATYPHVLGFPLQMQLMASRTFPLALPGLVHVRNTIDVRRPVRWDEPLQVRVHAEELRAHEKGTQVDLVTDVTASGEPVWTGNSTYLARGVSSGATSVDEVEPDPVVDEAGGRPSAVWRVPKDTGRRYAAVSGDVNPIHLNPLAAKAFGFPRAIAHGMWAKARCLAALEGRLPDAFRVDVTFRKPLLLPSTAELRESRQDDGWLLQLTAARRDVIHLLAAITPL